MVELYPPIEPHDRGLLAVGDGHFVGWEVSVAPRTASRLSCFTGAQDRGFLSKPPVELARAWPGAELVVLSDAGHLRAESKRLALLRAMDKFGRG
jgi:hypothetical protein